MQQTDHARLKQNSRKGTAPSRKTASVVYGYYNTEHLSSIVHTISTTSLQAFPSLIDHCTIGSTIGHWTDNETIRPSIRPMDHPGPLAHYWTIGPAIGSLDRPLDNWTKH